MTNRSADPKCNLSTDISKYCVGKSAGGNDCIRDLVKDMPSLRNVVAAPDHHPHGNSTCVSYEFATYENEMTPNRDRVLR